MMEIVRGCFRTLAGCLFVCPTSVNNDKSPKSISTYDYIYISLALKTEQEI